MTSQASVRNIVMQCPSGCFNTLQSNRDKIGQVESHLVLHVLPRLVIVGGESNTNPGNSVRYGLSNVNSNNALTIANGNVGARLNFVNDSFTVIPTLPNGRIEESIQPGSVTLTVNSRENNKGNVNMRHRLTDCYARICMMDTLEKAADEACRPRHGTKEVALFDQDRDNLLRELQYDLINHQYVPGDYNIYYKLERGKMRLIADQPLYPHRIVLCAIALVIEDDLNRTLIWQTHASIKGHGTHTAMVDIRKRLYKDERIGYCLKMDIDQYFKSIDTAIMKMLLREYIKDKELLSLIDRTLDAYNETGNSGITLGGRLSPLFANLYLSSLDHYLKEVRHVHVMARYMDNYYIFGYSRAWLEDICKDVIANLAEIGLRLNPD